jgi:hypothetical protein
MSAMCFGANGMFNEREDSEHELAKALAAYRQHRTAVWRNYARQAIRYYRESQ